jgi:pSer/pThr/pTyr-binding forkhead associated (FHA) protein
MNVTKITIGRSEDCDYVIEDSSNKLSRTHAEVVLENGLLYLKDTSQNGIFVNNQRMTGSLRQKINSTDKILLLNTYPVELFALFTPGSAHPLNDDQTKVMGAGAVLVTGLPFKGVGRSDSNQIRIVNNSVSREHCKLRLISSDRFEVKDLGSSNGTFVNEKKLKPNKLYQFPLASKVKLGGVVSLDLAKCLGIKTADGDKTTIGAPISNAVNVPPTAGPQGIPPQQSITPQERIAFAALEGKFKEFDEWQRKPSKIVNSYSIGGTIFGGLGTLVIVAVNPDKLLMMVPMLLGGVLGRYVGQKKADQIRDNVAYRDKFLVEYACPRCKQSFQTMPWITIRQCNKCRLNFK